MIESLDIYQENAMNFKGLLAFSSATDIFESKNFPEEYSYDHNGIRKRKTVFHTDGTNTTVYYVNDNYIKIINSSGTYDETYYYLKDKIVGKKDTDDNLLFFHPDHLGSTRLITDAVGNTVADLSYEPFGKLIGSSSERLLYEGKEKDTSGLYYFNARYYDAANGPGFTQPDTIIQNMYDPQTLNRYSFERNNPYRYVDPTGNYIETAVDIGFIAYDIQQIREDPSLTNYLALGADVGGALLPFATGLGLGVRTGVKGLDKVGDANKLVKGVKRLPKKTPGGTEATLNLFQNYNSIDSGDQFKLFAHLVDGTWSWDEGTGTAAGSTCSGIEYCWNNKPEEADYSSTAEDSVTVNYGDASQWLKWDVKNAMQSVLDNDYNNISLYILTQIVSGNPSNTDYVRFSTKEGNDGPYLNVTYKPAGPAIKEGLVSTIIGDIPFYTNGTNPVTVSLSENQCQNFEWWVNATGDVGTSHIFFGYANITATPEVSHQTENINITII